MGMIKVRTQPEVRTGNATKSSWQQRDQVLRGLYIGIDTHHISTTSKTVEEHTDMQNAAGSPIRVLQERTHLRMKVDFMRSVDAFSYCKESTELQISGIFKEPKIKDWFLSSLALCGERDSLTQLNLKKSLTCSLLLHIQENLYLGP
ncbi:hypothetical protein HID58_035157 [Brassica napus]|uniref:(rape) hypothetical protein n=1 Tax=Brassica napus TaxID=3708 RepID=A0A816PB02_BRANA|nr:hypothetical protein HID58_035157 [Brassica napus]CAF2046722.1 unnamed protein product [Brassica napus]